MKVKLNGGEFFGEFSNSRINQCLVDDYHLQNKPKSLSNPPVQNRAIKVHQFPEDTQSTTKLWPAGRLTYQTTPGDRSGNRWPEKPYLRLASRSLPCECSGALQSQLRLE